MSVIAKDNPYGLESSIKRLQQHISDYLTAIPWSGTNNVYSLVHKNTRKINDADQVVAESYIGSGIKNKEYGEVFFNDKISSSIGFMEQGNRTMSMGTNTVDVLISCTLKFDKVFPESSDRPTELILLQFEKMLNKYGFLSSDIQEIRIGVKDVFSNFYYDNVVKLDMHPWFVFGFLVTMRYRNNLTCTSY